MSRLEKLRSFVASLGADGFILPRADEYLGEYVPACAERLKWLTGFSGSAGIAIILSDKAVVMSDGRYTAQLRQQVDPAFFQYADSTRISVPQWLQNNAAAGTKILFDPWLHTQEQIEGWQEKIKGFCHLIPAEQNIVDLIWADRPAPPKGVITLFSEKFAGLSSSEKRHNLAVQLQQEGVQACLIGLPDSIAWLLNIRGNDVPYIPVALSYGCLFADGTFDWIIDGAKVSDSVRQVLGQDIRITTLADTLGKLSGKVQIDKARSSAAFFTALEKAGVEIVQANDPTILPKACKNPSEIAAIKQAHQKDSKAVCAFLNWFEKGDNLTQINEINIETALEGFRKQDPDYREPSFPTIAGVGPNGAIIHYRATPETARTLETGTLLLLDSGGQYSCGTTDITRTLAIGRPSDEMRFHYTQVLKAHIALSCAIFPKGTTGAQIDALVRAPLWAAGMDFAHGTGHGVGCYLSVHEEAASISPRGKDPLLPGMVLSNEPGFYKEGAYGIRIENLVLVIDLDRTLPDGRPLYGFETLTKVPYDQKLTDRSLLTESEKKWLDEYAQI